MMMFSVENALNMDADFDPRRLNLRCGFVDWIEASSPHPPLDGTRNSVDKMLLTCDDSL